MVWAGIWHDGRTQLKIIQGTLNAVIYRNDILDPIILPFLQQRNFDHVFQHDNARCNVARVCQDFLNQNHIRVLSWPALSSDLSPIEHLWGELGSCGRVVQHPTSLYPTRDWFYASEMRSCCCCKRWSHTLLNSANLHTTWQFLTVHDLLILLILPYLLFPYESKLYDFYRFAFSM